MMGRHHSLRMVEHDDRFIDERIASDGAASAEAVVEADLRRLEEREREMERLHRAFDEKAERPMSLEEVRQAIREGEDGGEAGVLDVDALFEDTFEEAAERRWCRPSTLSGRNGTFGESPFEASISSVFANPAATSIS